MIRVTVEGADVAAVRLALLDVLEVMMPKGPLVPVAAPAQPQVAAPVAAAPVPPAPTQPVQARRGRKAKQPTPVASDPLPVAVETDPEQDDVPPVEPAEDLRDDGTKALLDSLDPPAPTAIKVTRDQLRDAAQAFIQARGVNAAMELLGQYGVTKFAELPEAKWGEMFTKLGGKL